MNVVPICYTVIAIINNLQVEAAFIKVSHGSYVKGFRGKDINGNTYFGFTGIPYAEPPLGKLRFKAPVPKVPWMGIFDATHTPNTCVQLLQKVVEGDEDCLTLSVYTPDLPIYETIKLKPVMVHFHGGAFINDEYVHGPEELMIEDVLLVTVKYRLGVFGFLAFDDVSLKIPGNAALKDMVLALKWVKDNIQFFMGDPNKVTIFGSGAGGASTHYLMLSPRAKNLFHRVISSSGTALSLWAKGKNNNGKDLARIVDCENRNLTLVVKCLRNLSSSDIVAGYDQLIDSSIITNKRYFAPIVEKPSKTAFLIYEPLNIITSGKYNHVPFMLGYTNKEGAYCYELKVHRSSMQCSAFEDYELVPYDLNLIPSNIAYRQVTESVKKFYFSPTRVAEINLSPEYIAIAGDNYYIKEIYRTAKHHLDTAKKSIYFYRFSVDMKLNRLRQTSKVNINGASHSEEESYLFSTSLSKSVKVKRGGPMDKLRRTLVKLWTQFARNGDPNSNSNNFHWKPLDSKFSYLEIGDKIKADTKPDEARMEFWRKIYKRFHILF